MEYYFVTAGAISCLLYTSYMVYFIAGLTGISTDVYESAKLDGANGAQTLFRITIPLMAPVLKMILMLSLIHI